MIFSALNGAGIGVFYIYIYSAVAGPFGKDRDFNLLVLTAYSVLAYCLVHSHPGLYSEG